MWRLNAFFCIILCVHAHAATCPVGFTDHTGVDILKSMFMVPVDGRCVNSAYEYVDIPDTFVPIYNGFVDGATVTLCGAGQYLANGTTCTDYAKDDCPGDFVDIAPGDTFFNTPIGGQCGTGYSTYSINQQCDDNTTDSMCAVLCSDGLLYTDVGTCATLCAAGATSLNMKKNPNSPTISFPLYSAQQSYPSMAVGLSGGVCFVNLVVGAGNDALNVQKDGVTYHTVR